jgi:putative transposase
MILSPAGMMVNKIWKEIPQHYSGCYLDVFQIMPNHFHAILIIDHSVGAGPRACPECYKGQPQGVAPTPPTSLPDIVSRFKSLTQHIYGLGVQEQHWPMFNKRLWQRNYYEHIVRNEKDYWAINQYIQDNPKNWGKDECFSPLNSIDKGQKVL